MDSLHGEGRTIIAITHDQEVALRAQRQVLSTTGSVIEETS